MPDLIVAIGFSLQRRALHQRRRRIEGVIEPTVIAPLDLRQAARMDQLEAAQAIGLRTEAIARRLDPTKAVAIVRHMPGELADEFGRRIELIRPRGEQP